MRLLQTSRWLGAALLVLAGCHVVLPLGAAPADAGLSDHNAAERPLDLPNDGTGTDGSLDQAVVMDTGPDDAAVGDATAADLSALEGGTGDGGQSDGSQLDGSSPVGATLLWAKTLGGPESDRAWAVGADGSGNAYIAGHFAGSVTFGGSPVSATGTTIDLFVASYGPDGSYRWELTAGGTDNDIPHALAVDTAGASIVSGTFGKKASFGSHSVSSVGDPDVFVARASPQGSWLWATATGTANPDSSGGVALSSSGRYAAAAKLGPGGELQLTSATATTNSGAWEQTTSSMPIIDAHPAVAINAVGAITLAGSFLGTLTLGCGTLTNNSSRDIFVASFNSNGTATWCASYGGTESEQARAIALDGVGNLYLVGSFVGNTSFAGGPTLVSAGGSDIFLLSLTATGAHRWSMALGGSGGETAKALVLNASGNVCVAGSFIGTTDLGSGSWTSAGLADAFVACYAPGGAHLWSRHYGAAGNVSAEGLALAPNGDLLVTGYFAGTVDFGDGPRTSNGGTSDIFLLRLRP